MTVAADQASLRVAVCICTADRPTLLARVLQALEKADLGELPAGSVELMVIDNRPGGSTAQVVEAAKGRLPFAVSLVEEHQPGISAARNRAVSEVLARGADALAFIDDDDEPRPDWLLQLVREQARSGADIVFGAHRHAPDAPVPEYLRASFVIPKPYPSLNKLGVPAGASTCNVLIMRHLLIELGRDGPVFRPQFSASGGGDTDLFVRAARAGYSWSIAWRSEVWLRWEPDRYALRGVLRRQFRYGFTRHFLVSAHDPSITPGDRRLKRALRRSWRRAKHLVLRGHIREERLELLFKLADSLGELNAALGRSHAYYDAGGRPAASLGSPIMPMTSPSTLRVALCVCTADRHAELDRLLHSLRRMDLGEFGADEVRLIIVDNRPERSCRSVVDGHRGHLPITVELVEEAKKGISFARNRAVGTALGLGADMIAFIDDDDEPRRDWLVNLVKAQREQAADMVLGLWAYPDGFVLPDWLGKVPTYRLPTKIPNSRFGGLPTWGGTYNMLLTRSLIERLAVDGELFRGAFARIGGEDTDLLIRAHRAGCQIGVADHSIILRHFQPERLSAFGMFRRAFRYGNAAMHLANVHLPPNKQRDIARVAKAEAMTNLKALMRRGTPESDRGRQLYFLGLRLGELAGSFGYRYRYYS